MRAGQGNFKEQIKVVLFHSYCSASFSKVIHVVFLKFLKNKPR